MTKVIYVNLKMVPNKTKLPLVIGFFDGIHLGHKRLFKNKKFNILTFINVPTKNNEFLFDNTQRLNILTKLKAEHVYILDLSKNNFTTEKFVEFLTAKINPSKIIVGKNFKFGKDRKGNTNILKKHFITNVINLVDGISSSNIKSLIKNGKIDIAQKQLCTKFGITNKVIHGKAYGRTLGFPTANIYNHNQVISIKSGVYAGFTKINDKVYPSAIFAWNNKPQLIESHLINFNQDIYDKTITVMPIKFINGFKKAKNGTDLKKVIGDNVKEIKTFLKL